MITISTIHKYDKDATLSDAEPFLDIWNSVVNSIIKKMIAYSTPKMVDIHINLREEYVYEIASITGFLSDQVVSKRMGNKKIHELDFKNERYHCLESKDGKDKIENTAQNFSNYLVEEKYNKRWKPKTIKELERERSNEVKEIISKPVSKNHFIPKFYIKKYWSLDCNIQIFYKNSLSFNKSTIKSYGSWGFSENIYSDRLEAYFGLIEGDAAHPIEMILSDKPVNAPQRKALIGFIVLQQIRNPSFIRNYNKSTVKYESIYKDHAFYDSIARPILFSDFVLIFSEHNHFILPDTFNIIENIDNRKFSITPIDPRTVLVSLPNKITKPNIIPYKIRNNKEINNDIQSLLLISVENSFICQPTKKIFNYPSLDYYSILDRLVNNISIQVDDFKKNVGVL